MKKRMFLMLAVVLAFLAAIGGFKFFQIKSAMAAGANYQPPPEAVTTVVAGGRITAIQLVANPDKLRAVRAGRLLPL